MFFKSRKKSETNKPTIMTAYDRIVYWDVTDSSDETLFAISDKILEGYPVLANFATLDVKVSNSMLAFLSGVIYATGGQTLKIQQYLFLLGRKEEFEDGSLYQYYEDLK